MALDSSCSTVHTHIDTQKADGKAEKKAKIVGKSAKKREKKSENTHKSL